MERVIFLGVAFVVLAFVTVLPIVGGVISTDNPDIKQLPFVVAHATTAAFGMFSMLLVFALFIFREQDELTGALVRLGLIAFFRLAMSVLSFVISRSMSSSYAVKRQSAIEMQKRYSSTVGAPMSMQRFDMITEPEHKDTDPLITAS